MNINYGKWETKADRDKFQDCINLKHDIQMIAGIYQNDMTITHEDIKELSNRVNKVVSALSQLKSDVVSNLGENLNPCKHLNVEKYQEFCPHKGYSTVLVCQDCKEEVL